MTRASDERARPHVRVVHEVDARRDVRGHRVLLGDLLRAARMLLYSDGAYELEPPDGRFFALEDFKSLATRLATSRNGSIDELVEELRALTPTGGFEDDCSLIGLRFN